jgi:hypothetical protein
LIGRIKDLLVAEFELDASKVWLTSPSFFANITAGLSAKKMNDVYWKEHIDKIVRLTFCCTSVSLKEFVGANHDYRLMAASLTHH